MKVSDFGFELPAKLIAQKPAAERTDARLLYVNRATGDRAHTTVAGLPELLKPGDVLVVNNTRVFPARLLGHRVPSGGAVECLLIRRIDDDRWEALMHPGQKLKPGSRVIFEGPEMIHAEVEARQFYGRRTIRLWTDSGANVDAAVDAIGHVPLPPYIKRPDQESDRDRYQTIFADRRGSVAAPTAGLHFSQALLDRLRFRGVEVVDITLHVGYGTFQPVRVEQVEDHRLDAESYEIDRQSAEAINRALDEGRRVIAVGTTTTRTLEAVARSSGGRLVPGQGETDLFIYPGFEFRAIEGLLTNFHLPESSLLMLVCAFAGRERVLAAYHEAVSMGYLFYSYGDAMLIL